MIINFLKVIIPVSIKSYIFCKLNSYELKLNNNNRAFIFLSADYGNIGDIAISKAQHKFLETILPNYDICDIPISQTRLVIKSIKKQINSNDVVTIIGGGNMGSIYPDIEELRQLVIRTFPNNRIVCFPQTIDWSNNKSSNKALKRIQKIYSKHSDIHIFARESISYQKLSDMFDDYENVHIGLVPDIVLSTCAKQLRTEDQIHSNLILKCLRDDKETWLSSNQHSFINDALNKTGYLIEATDTHAGGSQLSEALCQKLLSDKLNQFRSAKLVITDRLHGMILSLLSGTPCLVLPNSNHKIRQTYEDWIHSNPRVKFVEPEKFDEIPEYIHELLTISKGNIEEKVVNADKYDSLKRALVSL